ncbi:MAG: hypothetical protein KJP18_09475 [Gemmatimonadetes bacterium]|nr:hypothetical protein [Gemmatimonadota bacterium]NNF38984.1 hypothetical protein [Gemmatimonadota bacterium]
MPVPPEGRERGVAMGRRVLRHARALGLGSPDLALIERVHARALEVRAERADDDHDPPFLHHGRSALVLLIDVRERDSRVLSAAMGVDSEDPSWAPDLTGIGDERLERLIAQIPASGVEDLAERLWSAEPEACRAALAERLDHLRHAHLWADHEARRRAHEEAVAVYAPMAERTHPQLAHRYAWWCRMFGARHLS